MLSRRQNDNPAGATDNLGGRISRELLMLGSIVRALVRDGSDVRAEWLRECGAEVVEVNYDIPDQLAEVCTGGSCVVSAFGRARCDH